MNNEKTLLRAFEWINEQIEKNPFLDIGFELTVHAGEIRKVNYSITQKIIPATSGKKDETMKPIPEAAK